MSDDKYDDKNALAEMRLRLNELQRENLEIRDALKEVAQANMLPGIVQHGFDCVIAQLGPLRELAPTRASAPQATADAANAMLVAMQGVTLTGGSLGIPEVNVPFIGQPPASLVLEQTGQSGTPVLTVGGPGNPGQVYAPNQQLYRREFQS